MQDLTMLCRYLQLSKFEPYKIFKDVDQVLPHYNLKPKSRHSYLRMPYVPKELANIVN